MEVTNCLLGEHLPAKSIWMYEEAMPYMWLIYCYACGPAPGASEEIDLSANKKGKGSVCRMRRHFPGIRGAAGSETRLC